MIERIVDAVQFCFLFLAAQFGEENKKWQVGTPFYIGTRNTSSYVRKATENFVHFATTESCNAGPLPPTGRGAALD
jgi:hypothetical protein